MKSLICWKVITLGIIGGVLFLGLAYASGEDSIRLQGKIMDLDLKRNMMTVNERLFVWNGKTIMNNSKGSSITIDEFKPKSWVYIEGMKDKKNNRIIIEKIYLLPKYVNKKERHLYPFVDLE